MSLTVGDTYNYMHVHDLIVLTSREKQKEKQIAELQQRLFEQQPVILHGALATNLSIYCLD